MTPPAPPADRTERSLLHRWFVEYNPIYLLSAALALGGLWLLLKAAVEDGSRLGAWAVSGLAELYAFALIGGAALLVRHGQRRAGVMLGLLAMLYQGDLTMHIELSAFVGGALVSGAWVLVFAIKLALLLRALELRIARRTFALLVTGATVVAALPHVMLVLGRSHTLAGEAIVACAMFALSAAGLYFRHPVESAVGFDVRGRRAIGACWGALAGASLIHVGWLVADRHLDPRALLLPLAFALTRLAPGHRSAIAWVAGLVALTGLTDPAHLALASLLGAATLVLRALRRPSRPSATNEASAIGYRGAASPDPAPTEPPPITFARASGVELARLSSAALLLGYVGVLAVGLAPDEALHPNGLALVVLAVAAAGLAWRLRSLTPLAAPIAAGVHALVGDPDAPPRSLADWGALLLAAAFALLALGVGHAMRRARAAAREPDQPAGAPSCSAR